MTSQHAPGPWDDEDPVLAPQLWWPGPPGQPGTAPLPVWGARQVPWPRLTAAILMTVTFSVLVPVALLSAWIRGTVLSTNGYAAAVAPVAASPVVRAAVQDAITAQVPLFPAAALAGPRQVYRIVNVATALTLILTAAAFAGAVAVAVAPRRARVTLLQLALAGTITALAARIAVSLLDSTLIAKSAPHYQAVAGVIMHALTNGFFTINTWVLLGGLALAVGTLLAGPYRWTTYLRTALRIAR